jgi:hypothetical protein
MTLALQRPILGAIPAQISRHQSRGLRWHRVTGLNLTDAGFGPVAQNLSGLLLRKAQRLPGLFEICGGHGLDGFFFAQAIKLGAGFFALVAAKLAFSFLKAKLCMGQPASFVCLTNGCCGKGFHVVSPVWASARFHEQDILLRFPYRKRKVTQSVSRNVTAERVRAHCCNAMTHTRDTRAGKRGLAVPTTGCSQNTQRPHTGRKTAISEA